MFVPDDIWVTANFKETQLDHMRPGQPVTMGIDAYPERVLHGHVASVQPGSGTAFSLLPAENATGNYVKIVQRVPVKIVFDDIADGRRRSVPACRSRRPCASTPRRPLGKSSRRACPGCAACPSSAVHERDDARGLLR